MFLLLGVLCVVAVYSLYSVISSNRALGDSDYPLFDSNAEQNKRSNRTDKDISANQIKTNQARIIAPTGFKSSVITDASAKELPIDFTLVGIEKATQKESQSRKRKILVKYNYDFFNYVLNDEILDTGMILSAIDDSSVQISYQGNEYTKALSPPNMLSENYLVEQKSYEEYMQMSPKEIGTRPRIIEHIISYTPTAFIADGILVSPGINPDLFEQAGLQEDDVLKTINGKSVTIESEFEEIKRSISNAHTLVFVVMRKGRPITLYLDIPSEALSFSD